MEAYLDERIAIKVEGLTKKYRLGQLNSSTLTHDLQSWWARVRHKEDPNIPVYANKADIGKEFWALSGIDLTINKGETIGIIGSNGAGKSTLLKIISHITAPTAGRVLINGRISSMLEVGTGFNPEMTGRENIYINGAILGMTKAEIDNKMDSIIAFSECEEFIDTPVKRYSSGMYVKLAFSVASHLDNEIVIMDEVFAVGDVRFQKKCTDKMRSLAEQDGRTILFVSHSIVSIRQVCQRVVVLEKGRIVFDGNTESAIEYYIGKDKMPACADVDLDALPRDNWYVPRARLMRIRATDRSEPVYRPDEQLKCRIDWKLLESFDAVSLAITIRRADELAICRIWSAPIAGMRVNAVYESDCCLDIGMLVPGHYNLVLEILCRNEDGTFRMLDGLVGCYSLEITATEPLYANWAPQFWGNVEMPEMLVQTRQLENSYT